MISRMLVKAVFLGIIMSGCSDERTDADRDQKKAEPSDPSPEVESPEQLQISQRDLELACSGLRGVDAVGEAKMAGDDGKSCVPLSEGVDLLQGTYRADRRFASFDMKIVGKMFLMALEQREEEDVILSSLRMGNIEITKDGKTLFHTWQSTCEEAPFTKEWRLAIMYDDIQNRLGRKFFLLESLVYEPFVKSSDKPVKYGCFRNGEFTEQSLMTLK